MKNFLTAVLYLVGGAILFLIALPVAIIHEARYRASVRRRAHR